MNPSVSLGERSSKQDPSDAVCGAPGVSVWLVDDNSAFRQALAELLRHQQGICCERDFASPDAALSALASKAGPDVILLDVQMGDRNGLDAIGPIKALSRATQVLMLTSSFDPEGYQQAMNAGASDFLLKSYSPEEITHRIRHPSRRVTARVKSCRTIGCLGSDRRTPAGGKATTHSRKQWQVFRRWFGST